MNTLAPASPFSPRAPGSPFAPGSRSAPCGPARPAGPTGPRSPTGPAAPAHHAALAPLVRPSRPPARMLVQHFGAALRTHPTPGPSRAGAGVGWRRSDVRRALLEGVARSGEDRLAIVAGRPRRDSRGDIDDTGRPLGPVLGQPRALPPLRPAAAFWALVPPWLESVLRFLLPHALPPFSDASDVLAIFARPAPFSFPSYADPRMWRTHARVTPPPNPLRRPAHQSPLDSLFSGRREIVRRRLVRRTKERLRE